MFIDPVYLMFLLPGLILAAVASMLVKTTFSRYARVRAYSGMTGAQAAERMLRANGVFDVQVEQTQGFLSDHYDPTRKVLRLSPDVYGSNSLSAVGVACHEAGHALQHAAAYAPLTLRTLLVPATNFASMFAFYVFFAGLLFNSQSLVYIGCALFAVGFLFAVVTLPVEWDASARAKQHLATTGIVSPDQVQHAGRVLNAAFLTYLAGAVSSLCLLYFMFRRVTWRTQGKVIGEHHSRKPVSLSRSPAGAGPGIHSLLERIAPRELISNASDAIDRAQYLGLTDVADRRCAGWKIDLIVDKEDKTLTITDNGIGMNEEDLDKNLGVIANSGTKAFAQALKEKQQTNIPELIGQFGVGFYAAFMVAESVTVITLKRGEGQKAVKWTSTGTGSYTLEEAARDKPGTTIVLKLREGMEEFLNEWRLHELVKKYSDFIAYPIRFSDTGEAPAEDAQPFNTMKAIWKRPKSELTEEATNEFYTHLTHDYNPPLKTIPMSVEGVVEFKALLFLPKQAGIDLMMPNKKYGLHLYVRNVFIGADFDLLLPEYLRFVKGVVDSSDLPLNVSREMLQDDAVIRKIKSNITGKVLSTLAEMMADEPETYTAFFTAFGRVLKEGLHHDYENADKLKALMMFRSATRDGNALISLADYVKAMPETQQDIYYLIAEDLETAKRAPHIEALTKRGYDVLLFTDPIDQWIADTLREFEGKKLVAVDKGALEVGTDEEKAAAKKKIETAADDFKELTAFIQEHLKDHVKEVRFSPRLTDSACCLVADENALNPSMERLMRAMNQDVPKQLRTLELNPDHAVIARMKSMLEADKADPRLADFADLLFGQALLAEGSAPQNPQRFTQLVAELMTQV